MKTKFKQGIYTPKNPDKYVHSKSFMNEKTNFPIYRSSRELKFFKFCDYCDEVFKWTSEPFKIDYFNPVKQRMARYFPDALINYNGVNYLIEIKPIIHTPGAKTKSTKNKIEQIINEAKWEAARDFCANHNYKFIILGDNFFKY